jgi:hypothetical protein
VRQSRNRQAALQKLPSVGGHRRPFLLEPSC